MGVLSLMRLVVLIFFSTCLTLHDPLKHPFQTDSRSQTQTQTHTSMACQIVYYTVSFQGYGTFGLGSMTLGLLEHGVLRVYGRPSKGRHKVK